MEGGDVEKRRRDNAARGAPTGAHRRGRDGMGGEGAGGAGDVQSNGIAILATVVVMLLALAGVAAFYPKALAQSHYYAADADVKTAKLPGTVSPLSYDVHLHPNLETGMVEGEERVLLRVDKPVSRIALHMQGMNITGLNLKVGSTMAAGILHTEHDKGLAHFTFQQPIPAGEAYLELSFNSRMRQETMQGFFLRTFNSRLSSRKNVRFAATYFDPTGLRDAFPSFDEPHFKANFTLSIAVPEGYEALASTKEIDAVALQMGGRKVRFQPTQIPVSPSKLAFAVVPLKSIQTTTSKGILLRVWAEDGLQAQSRLALRLAVDAIEYLTRYTGVALPLNKLDLVGLPDFVDGVRQSWGLCTFLENALIYDVSMSPATDRARIGTAVWRCVADHWFTDYLAPRDNKHAWLHEAFSTLVVADVFAESSALNIVGGSHLSGGGGDDDRSMWIDVEDMHQGLMYDSLPSARALESIGAGDHRSTGTGDDGMRAASRASAVGVEVLDDHTVRKAAGVLNMLRLYVEDVRPGAFGDGLRRYFSQGVVGGGGLPQGDGVKAGFGGAQGPSARGAAFTPDTLWAALDAEAGEGADVPSVIEGWLTRPSFPLIEVDVDRDVIVMKQRQYTLRSDGITGSAKWHIPLQYRSPALPNGSAYVVMHPTPATARVTCTECLAPIVPLKTAAIQASSGVKNMSSPFMGSGNNVSSQGLTSSNATLGALRAIEDSNRTAALELEIDDISQELSAAQADEALENQVTNSAGGGSGNGKGWTGMGPARTLDSIVGAGVGAGIDSAAAGWAPLATGSGQGNTDVEQHASGTRGNPVQGMIAGGLGVGGGPVGALRRNGTVTVHNLSHVLDEAKVALQALQARNLELQKHTDELEGRLKKEPSSVARVEGQLLPAVEVAATTGPGEHLGGVDGSSVNGISVADGQRSGGGVGDSDSASGGEVSPVGTGRKDGRAAEGDGGASSSDAPSRTSDMFANGGWIKVNAGQHSFVRVDYKEREWNAFAALLARDATAMSPADRAGLLDDAFSFVYSGVQEFGLPLRLSRYLVNETEPEPWMTALGHFRQLSSIAYEEPWVEELSAYVLGIVEPAVFSNQLIPNARTATTWRSTPITSILLEAAVEFRSVSVTAELAALFPGGLPGLASGSITRAVIRDFFRSTHPDVRGAVLQALTATGAPGTFDAVLAIYHAAQLPADRLAALRALALSKNHHERIRLLNMAVEAHEMTFSEGTVVFEFMSRNHEGRSTTWRKLKDNWNILRARYSHGPRDLDKLVRAVVSSFTSHALHRDISEFFNAHTHTGVAGAISQALDVVEQNADWLSSHSAEAERFLQEAQISAADDDSTRDDGDESDEVLDQDLDMASEGEADLLQLPLKLSSPL